MNPIEFPDIQLIDIEIIEDQIKGTKKFISNQVEPGGAKLGIKFDHAFDLNDKIIRINLTLRVNGIDAKGLKIGLNGRYQLCFFFQDQRFGSIPG